MAKHLKFCLIIAAVIAVLTMIFIKNGPQSFVFAWILNFALMIAVFFYTEAFKPKFTSAYYNSKGWEVGGTVYKWVGINLFRKFLVLIGWEKVIRAANPIKNNIDAIKHLERGTRQSEFGHLLIFFVVLAVNIYVAFSYGVNKSLSLFTLNIVFNLYSVMLQRFNRPRLQRALRIAERRA